MSSSSSSSPDQQQQQQSTSTRRSSATTTLRGADGGDGSSSLLVINQYFDRYHPHHPSASPSGGGGGGGGSRRQQAPYHHHSHYPYGSHRSSVASSFGLTRHQICLWILLLMVVLMYVQNVAKWRDIQDLNNLQRNSYNSQNNMMLKNGGFGTARLVEGAAERERLRERERLSWWGGSDVDSADRGEDGYDFLGMGGDRARGKWEADESAPITYPQINFDYTQKAVPSEMTLAQPTLYDGNDENSKTNRTTTLDDNNSSKAIDRTVIVVVLSARGNFERRKAIRETWGRDHALYFVVGGPTREELLLPSGEGKERTESDSVQQVGNVTEGNATTAKGRKLVKSEIQLKVEEEQAAHRDLLDSIHPDSYQSLPYKIKYAYHWVSEHLEDVEWVMKVDDDTVVRVDTLRNAFLRNFNSRVPMVIGQIIERSAVARQGKWADFKYDRAWYPYWAQGSCGYVVSRPVVDYIAQMDPSSIVYYQGEDTSVGIWLDEAPEEKLGNQHVTWVQSAYFRNDGKCEEHAWLSMGHEISAEHMRACHEKADEWPLEDIKHHHRRYWKIETLQERQDSGYFWEHGDWD